MKKHLPILIFIFTILLNVVLHWTVFQKEIIGIHTWRQSQTQWNIRNFYRTDANILNPRVAHFNEGKDNLYRYEFPVMQWSIAMVHKVFGEYILITRVCVFLIGLFSLLAFYKLLIALAFDPLIAAIGFWTFSFSPLFYYYTVNPLPDNLALCGGLWYLFFFVKSVKEDRWANHIFAAFFLLLATLAKLPFILFGGATFAYFLLKGFGKGKYRVGWLSKRASVYMIMMTPALLWYAWVIPGWEGNGILAGVFDNKISLLQGLRILGYNIKNVFSLVLLNPACWLFLGVTGYSFFKQKWYQKKITVYLSVAFVFVGLYFLLELNMIGLVHDYYLMPFLPFLFLIVIYGLDKCWNKTKAWQLFTLLSILAMPIFCFFQNRNSWTAEQSGFNPDFFKYQTALKNAVPNNEKCIILNDVSRFVFPYLIDKQGYVFQDDHLPKEWVIDLMNTQHIKYIYSDSKKINQDEDFKDIIEETILEVGSVKVFKLKKPK